jgi:hypothetical protein
MRKGLVMFIGGLVIVGIIVSFVLGVTIPDPPPTLPNIKAHFVTLAKKNLQGYPKQDIAEMRGALEGFQKQARYFASSRIPINWTQITGMALAPTPKPYKIQVKGLMGQIIDKAQDYAESQELDVEDPQVKWPVLESALAGMIEGSRLAEPFPAQKIPTMEMAR